MKSFGPQKSDDNSAYVVFDLCEEFEAKWESGSTPEIGDFLARCDRSLHHLLLSELVQVDMKNRWKKAAIQTVGEPENRAAESHSDVPSVSEYLKRFPELGTESTVQPELIALEFHIRSAMGHQIDLVSFCQHYGCEPNEIDRELGALRKRSLPSESNLSTHNFDNVAATPAAHVEKTKTRPKCELGEVRGGRFVILREYDRGGMGVVYEAYDRELGRQVALKELQERFVDNEVFRLGFGREAEITGRLEHPGIAPIYSYGEYADGRPYYAMKLVAGERLDQAIERYHQQRHGKTVGRSEFHSLEFRALLGHISYLSNTIEFAHKKGYIHRDIKPSNVHIDRLGETVLLDWGLAKTLDPDDVTNKLSNFGEISNDKKGISSVGGVVGTLSYMSPEQAAGADISPASDVFSLGATLFHALIGEPAFAKKKGESNSDAAIRITEGDWESVAIRNSNIPNPLIAICEKAMSVEKSKRYQSAGDLAEDLNRYLAFEPISAWRESTSEKMRRWVRRHPWLRSAALAAAAAMIVAIAGLSWLSISLHKAESQVSSQNQILRRQKLFADEQQQIAEAKSIEANEQRKIAETERRAADRFAYNAILSRCYELSRNEPDRARKLLDGDECPLEFRDFSWYLLRRTLEKRKRSVQSFDGKVVALSPSTANANRIAIANDQGQLQILDIGAAGVGGYQGVVNNFRYIEKDRDAKAEAIAWSWDSQVIAVACVGSKIRVIRSDTGVLVRELTNCDKDILALRFRSTEDLKPTGELIAVDASGEIHAWNRKQDFAHRIVEKGAAQHEKAFGAALWGSTVVISYLGGHFYVYDLETNTFRPKIYVDGSSGEIKRLAIVPGSEDFYFADSVVIIRIVFTDPEDPPLQVPLHRDYGLIQQLAIDNGYQLAALSRVMGVIVWPFQGTPTRIPEGRKYDFIALSGDGRRLVGVEQSDGVPTFDIWNLGEHISGNSEIPIGGELSSIAQVSQNVFAVASRTDQKLTLVDASTQEKSELMTGQDPLVLVENSPDFRFLATYGGKKIDEKLHSGLVRIWSVETRELLGEFETETRINSLRFLAGTKLAAVHSDVIRVFDIENNKLTSIKVDNLSAILDDGRRIISCDSNGRVSLRSLTDGEKFVDLVELGSPVEFIRVVAGGRYFVAELENGSVGVSPLEEHAKFVLLANDNMIVNDFAFSPDGKTMAVAEENGNISLWDPMSGSERLVLPTNQLNHCTSVMFSRDGEKLVAVNRLGQMFVWQAPRNLKD